MLKVQSLSDVLMSSVPICKQTGGIVHLLKDGVAMKNSVFESINFSTLFVTQSLISVLQQRVWTEHIGWNHVQKD